MKQEKNGKNKIRVKGRKSEIMITKYIQEEEMRDKSKIEDASRSMKKWNKEERNI